MSFAANLGKTIKSSFLTLAVLTVSGLPVYSSAQAETKDTPELYFYPVSGWDARAVSMDGRDVCSIASEFNNGFIIQITGAKGKTEALHINFRQPAFEGQSKILTKLSVPGAASKDITADIATPELLSINMKVHQDLLHAMQNSAVLDLKIADNEFRFYLTGFNQSMKAYNSCVGAAPDVIAAKAVQEPVREAPSERALKQADQAKKKYEKEMALLMQGRDVPSKVVPKRNPEDVKGATPPKVQPHEFSERPDPNTGQRYTEKLAREMDTIQSMDVKSEFETPETNPTSAASQTAADAEKKSASLAERVEKEKADFAEKYGERIKVTKQKAKVEVDFTDLSNEDIAAQSGGMTPPPLPERDVAVAALRTPGNVSETDKEIRLLKDELNMIRSENEQLNAELKMALSESKREKVEISTDNWNLEKATMQYNEAERQIAALGQKIQKERAKCEMEKSELEMMLFDPQVTEKQQLAKLAALEEALNSAKKQLETQRKRYEEEIKLLKAGISQ